MESTPHLQGARPMRNRPLNTTLAAAACLSLTAACATATAAVGPAVAAASPGHPFPAHVTYKTGVTPSASQSSRDAAVEKQYTSWKKNYLRAACGGYLVYATGDAPGKGTVSE